jgi:Autotransporter beta-domain.
MDNNIRKIEQDLRAYAKRTPGMTYTTGTLMTFLIAGMLTLGNPAVKMDQSLEKYNKEVTYSMKDMESSIEWGRKQNQKLLKNANLELIQLMEQGDQVVKSPWNSWQVGANTYVGSWNSAYKGKGGKTADVVYDRNNGNPYSKYKKNTNSFQYGITDLEIVNEPSAEIIVNASIRPTSIDKEAPKVKIPEVKAPAEPKLNVSIKTPAAIKEPTVNPPVVNVNLPSPNTEPFNDFCFTCGGRTDAAGSMGNKIYWNGMTKEGVVSNVWGNSASTPETEGNRPPAIFYINEVTGSGKYFGDVTIYAAGNVNGSGAARDNKNGTIAIHTVKDNTLKNIKGHLGGRANFISIETWHGGKLDLEKVSVDEKGNENTIFYIYPSNYELITGADGAMAKNRRGGIEGKLNVDITSQRNTIYSVMGASGSFAIESKGLYQLEGASNIIYSGLGYSANFQNLINKPVTTGSYNSTIQDGRGEGFTPSIKLGTGELAAGEKRVVPKSYGDDNVIMFFNSKTILENRVNSGYGKYGGNANWFKSGVGIYQGEIRVKADIGEKLNINGTDTQTKKGNTIENNDGTVKKTGDNKYVEGNVGIFAVSGQRSKISPAEDLGAALSSTNGVDFNKDEVHSLQVNDIDINFGKYSKNGVMMVSQNGTVLDVVKSTNLHSEEIRDKTTGAVLTTKDNTTVPIKITNGVTGISVSGQTPNEVIKDFIGTTGLAGKISVDKNINEAAIGTIIAYSEGTWDPKKNDLMSEATKNALKGEKSEINIGRAVILSAKADVTNNGELESRPIAYVASNKGIITAENETEAKGFGSIIGYAESGGSITATGKVTAVDAWVATDTASQKQTYKNIGGYAKGAGSTVTLTGGADINGLGALANGSGATVTLDTASNTIKSGKEGALVAVDGGEVVFKGGTIENKDLSYEANSHDNVTPFFAKGNDSKIKFEGATTINMYDGILVAGEESDYEATVTGTKKYQGTGNVTVNLKKDGVNLGIFKGINATWDGNSGAYLNTLKTVPKFAAINNPNNYIYDSVLMNGTLTVDTDVNLDSATDGFNHITMERELVTINAGKTISGTTGKGLSMGSNTTATSNADSGYINNGTVRITGGTSTAGAAGINVSYGQIHNTATGIIEVDNGAGMYGTNGSLLKNEGIINVTGAGPGNVGIAGLATGTAGAGYGTDAGAAGKKVEIINTGSVNVTGDKAIAIFADNNKAGTPKSEVTIENSHQLTVGNSGTGIALKNSKGLGDGRGGIITVSGTGSSDIVAGTDGTGIYGEDVTVNLASDYGVETQDKGVGIYTKGVSEVKGAGKTFEYKYSGSATGNGTAVLFEGANPVNEVNINLVNSIGTTGGITGILAKGTGTLTNTGNITGTSSASEIGIIAENGNVSNSGNITLGDASDSEKPNVGIYVKNSAKTVTNSGDITVGKNSIGIYGYEVTGNGGNITVGDNGTGIFSQGGNVTLNGGKLTVGNGKAVGVLTNGSGQTITSTADIQLGNSKSYGFVIKGSGTNADINDADGTKLNNESVFMYSSDKTSNVINRTALESTGNKNYGLYSSGNVKNLADINFGIGLGNVGIFSVEDGTAVNGDPGLATQPVITTGFSNPVNKEYSIGMAAGYLDENTGKPVTTGHIKNYGTINVPQANGIGMYAAGLGSTADNYGIIELSGENSIGMYLDQGAVGVNHAGAEIRTAPNNNKDGIIGVVALNNALFKNYGRIIIDSGEGIGVYHAKDGKFDPASGSITVSGTGSKATDTATLDPTGKGVKGIKINSPGGGVTTATIERDGKAITPVYVDTTTPTPNPTNIQIGTTIVSLPEFYAQANETSPVNMGGGSSELGMYVDTSGVNYTNPIEGLQHLKNLRKVNLVFGTEATKYTNSKDIEIGNNIIDPYNTAITTVTSTGGGKTKWLLNSSSLTWIATATQNKDDTLAKVYMSKIPYTSFAKDTDTYNFMDGMEQRYGVEGLGTREKLLFNKLNDLGKGEGHIFTQAVDQMKGQQYANTQMRLYSTGAMLNKEFDHLRKEWDNKSKRSNKVKAFGMKDEYKTDTAGIIDYKANSYGVAYVHEKEDVRLGDTYGWYAGVIQNRFKFKDMGGSKENTTMLKAGVFKSIPFDYNNSLNVTVSAEGYVARSEMDRKFWIVDEVFGAKSTYNSYGAAAKAEVSKEFRVNETTSVRPYASIKAEYGRFNDIKEKTGEMRLDVEGNDYYSVKPEAGVEVKYKKHFAKKATFVTTVSLGYENELGKVADVNNRARVAFTEADWFKMRSEKDNRRGNFKADINIGIENQRVGFTLNAGYDTKGQNIRGGIGIRVIY